tara:strand:- start:6205 stop:6357 length:153 start_codon:yes stop_codon:yes gene_type:complete
MIRNSLMILAILILIGCTSKPKSELNAMEKFFDCIGSGNCEAFKKNSVEE